jgi:hypothetical protein
VITLSPPKCLPLLVDNIFKSMTSLTAGLVFSYLCISATNYGESHPSSSSTIDSFEMAIVEYIAINEKIYVHSGSASCQ